MDICQIKFLNVLLWFGFSFYGIFFWWCLAYFSFVAYPSGGHSKNSVNSVLTTQTHSFSFSYDFEFLFLSSVKYWPELFFCVWTGSCLLLLPNTFLSLNDLGIIRPGDYKWKGLFLGFQFYSPKQSELLTCVSGSILCMSSFTSQLRSDINIILSSDLQRK